LRRANLLSIKAGADSLYTMSYYVAGEKDASAMNTSLATLEKGTTILEH